jgi:FkbM family methyltransferase
MVYFPHDYYIGGALERYGEYSHLELELLLRYLKPGDVVVEAGANIGCHTLPIAQVVGASGRVLAFEPQRILNQMLCANLALNAVWNVFAERAAVGAVAGEIGVPPIDYSEPGNFGGVSLGVGAETVQVRTIDEFHLKRCDLIKIDVEGMELDVLKGAAGTIRRLRPTLYVENDRAEKSEALVRYLDELDYDLWWHLPPLFNPQNFKRDRDNVYSVNECPVVSLNMLCIHKRRAASVDLARVELPHRNFA